MDPNASTIKEAGVSSTTAQEPAGRRASAFGGRRKSSAVVDEAPAAVFEASALNADDRRLAEMGYVQVSNDTAHHLPLQLC